MTFADKLATLLETHRLDAPALSRLLKEQHKIKLTASTIYNYLNKPDVLPRFDAVEAMAKIFGVPLEHFTKDGPSKISKPHDLTDSELQIIKAFRASPKEQWEVISFLTDQRSQVPPGDRS